MNASSAGSSFPTKLRRALVLLLILLAGMTNLQLPFSGDQALFTLGAAALSRGSVLYRDFWDLKQPGIYQFYHVAGALFGYNEIGVHCAELLWFATLAIVISISMRSRFRIGWMSDVCALLTVFVYFAVCGTAHLTQLEGLVSLPIFLALLMVISHARNIQPSIARLIAFGMLAAVVVLFKLLLALILIAVFAASILPCRGMRLLRSSLIAFFGAMILLAPVVCYFGLQHQLPLVYKTFFIYPPRIAAELPMSRVTVLWHSALWFARAAAMLLPFAVIGIIGRVMRKPDRFAVAVFAWAVAATVIVLIQHLWWEYHFLLILFPVGILAAFGMEEAALWLRKIPRPASNTAIAAMIALLLCPYVYRLVHKAAHQIHDGSRQAFDMQESPPYADSLAEAQWLGSQRPGEIYVLGNPLIYYLSRHEQPIPMNGWSPEWLLPEQWDELVGELSASQPRYIFIDAANYGLLLGPGAVMKRLLSEDFTPSRVDENGTWYQRR